MLPFFIGIDDIASPPSLPLFSPPSPPPPLCDKIDVIFRHAFRRFAGEFFIDTALRAAAAVFCIFAKMPMFAD